MDLWKFFTPSLRAMAVYGPAATYASDAQSASSGYQAWAIFPELRLHLPTERIRPFVALGIGAGQLIGAQSAVNEVSPRQGSVGLFGQVSAGLQVAINKQWSVGAEAGLQRFTGVRGGLSYTTSTPTPAQEATESAEVAGFGQASLTFHFL
jgi:hypothetical protein